MPIIKKEITFIIEVVISELQLVGNKILVEEDSVVIVMTVMLDVIAVITMVKMELPMTNQESIIYHPNHRKMKIKFLNQGL